MIEWWWLLIVGFCCFIFGGMIISILAMKANADKDDAANRIFDLAFGKAYKGRMNDIRQQIRYYWGG